MSEETEGKREPKWWIYGAERHWREAVLAEYDADLCACGYEILRRNEISCSCGGDEHTHDQCVSEEFGTISREEAEK